MILWLFLLIYQDCLQFLFPLGRLKKFLLGFRFIALGFPRAWCFLLPENLKKMDNEKEKYYENYPLWIIFTTNLLSILIYLIGLFIIYQLGIFFLVLYLVYILILELRLISSHCSGCYYYGKSCAFGKGRLASLYFKKRDSKEFCRMKITWKSLIPDFLVSTIPIIVGIVLLIVNFSWLILFLIIALFWFMSIGNSFVRGKLACKFCMQRKLGCPAEKLFSKK